LGQALYRKYRSKKLSEVVGQDHITRTLENALKTGKISHAYLFTGPRGVGKTSIARILAHEINQLPYTDESMHLDIIEIDAASNRRIDEIRNLREKVHIAPTSAKYKVYIIDEVHMLTKEAFNALLKTLEEPPAHVIFILATTEIHKLPETIISRTQRFTFKPIDESSAIGHLQTIAEAEDMKVDKEALKLLAEHGRGSFRDSISLLDQVGHSQKSITRTDAERLVGLAPLSVIEALEKAIYSGSAADIVKGLDQLINDGVSASTAAKQLSTRLRARLLEGNADEVTVKLLGDLLSVPASAEPAAQLELALFRAQLNTQPAKTSTQEPKPTKIEKPDTAPAEPIKKSEPKAKTAPKQIVKSDGSVAEWWDSVLSNIKSINNTLYGVLRMAEPSVEDDTLHLKFGFGFHKKKADDTATQSKIHDAVLTVTGKSFRITTVHDASLGKQPSKPKDPEPAKGSDLSSITNIFGGGEVLDA